MNAASYLKYVPGILGSGLYETESTVRVLVAMDTGLLADDKFQKRAKELNMASMVRDHPSQHGTKAIAVANEIQMILE